MTTTQTDGAPIIASPEDIDAKLASRAFSGTSFSPEKRGEQRREEYAADVNGLYAELWPIAKTDEQRALLANEMERYKQGLREKLTAYLHSHSNVVSAMIAGPSNFPAARMQKRGQWADNKQRDLLEWRAKARAAIRRKLLDARPADVKEEQEWRLLERDLLSSLATVREIDAGQSFYARPLFVSSMAGKVERLAHNGQVELVKKALDLVRDYNAKHKKPAITARHKFWTFAETAAKIAALRGTRATAEPETLADVDGARIVANPQADRVQIFFPSKSAAMGKLAALKGAGWHWSPTEGAWQRKLTDAAKASAKQILAS